MGLAIPATSSTIRRPRMGNSVQLDEESRMKSSGPLSEPPVIKRVAAAICLAAVAGCGGLSPTVSASPPGSTADLGRASWIDPHVVTGPLLYASGGTSGSSIHIYTWPQPKLVGSLTGFGDAIGLCTDTRGNVFVVDPGKVYEFNHGGTVPVAVLQDKGGQGENCAVDPQTGDLAVTNEWSNYGGSPGSVAIYRHARGTATYYSDEKMPYMWYLAYDNAGNLFVDGSEHPSIGFRYAELPQGGQSLLNIRLKRRIREPGSLQWDGRHVAIGQESDASGGFVIYRTTGDKIVGTTRLGEQESYGTFLILGKTVLLCQDGLTEYKYPAGGPILRTIKLKGGPPAEVALSKL